VEKRSSGEADVLHPRSGEAGALDYVEAVRNEKKKKNTKMKFKRIQKVHF
jgi:hypothetical protein